MIKDVKRMTWVIRENFEGGRGTYQTHPEQ